MTKALYYYQNCLGIKGIPAGTGCGSRQDALCNHWDANVHGLLGQGKHIGRVSAGIVRDNSCMFKISQVKYMQAAFPVSLCADLHQEQLSLCCKA